MISRKTADELGVKNSDVVEVSWTAAACAGRLDSTGFRDYRWIGAGLRSRKSGRIGNKVGFNAYSVRTSGAENFAVGARFMRPARRICWPARRTTGPWKAADHPRANLKQYRDDPHFARKMDMEEPRNGRSRSIQIRWTADSNRAAPMGMSIDLNLCVAARRACWPAKREQRPDCRQDQVHRGRDMALAAH